MDFIMLQLHFCARGGSFLAPPKVGGSNSYSAIASAQNDARYFRLIPENLWASFRDSERVICFLENYFLNDYE
jgi:hypothetical protein